MQLVSDLRENPYSATRPLTRQKGCGIDDAAGAAVG